MSQSRLSSLLTPSEIRILNKLSTPQKIQDFLDILPINFELGGETYMSPRRVFETEMAHCLEGALVAAAALAYHGQRPLLMDFQTDWDDEDHVVALFKHNDLWGAISKTNHAVLRYRDAVYRSPRELAMSYFHEYFMWDGRKSLRAFSAPFDLSRYAPEKWITTSENLFFLAGDLDASRHFPIFKKMNARSLRRASTIEIENLKRVEWDTAGNKLTTDS
jgi:hypothetical protein